MNGLDLCALFSLDGKIALVTGARAGSVTWSARGCCRLAPGST